MKSSRNEYFALDGQLPSRTILWFQLLGAVLLICWWHGISVLHLLRNGVVPTPLDVARAFPMMFTKFDLVGNTLYSIILNLLGYAEAAIIGLPLGFLIGLQPWCRALFGRLVISGRYAPLSALIGPFMMAFGIETNMKVQYLAFGLLVYVVPQVIQRVDEVEKVYIQTMQTMGAGKWQIIRYVYLPAVISRVFSDFVVLSAISWTYIIIAEVVNMGDGGVGALVYNFYSHSMTGAMYGGVMVIMFVGFAFDKIGMWFDRKLFPYKYVNTGRGGSR